jgi:spermidine synthase
VGLGIGTLAAYGQEDDLMRFYEIDPAVVRIARDDGFFSFLRDSDAEIEVVVGDARLALADEQARGVRQSFDFLILDAFSSDAIPVHLLTREAFQTYVAALAPDGLIAAHVSNRHFELMGLVAAVGADLGMRSLQIATKQEPHLQSQLTSWVFLGREQRRMDRLAELVVRRHLAFGLDRQAIRLIGANPMQLRHAPIWTDDFSDLFGLLVPSR